MPLDTVTVALKQETSKATTEEEAIRNCVDFMDYRGLKEWHQSLLFLVDLRWLRGLPRCGFLPDNAVFRSSVLIQVAQLVG